MEMHGEQLSVRDVGCTGVILVGCAISVAFASHKDEVCDVPSLLGLYRTTSFALYASAIILLIVAVLVAIRYMERVQLLCGLRSVQYQQIVRWHRLSYAALSGITGAQSVLFAKPVRNVWLILLHWHIGICVPCVGRAQALRQCRTTFNQMSGCVVVS